MNTKPFESYESEVRSYCRHFPAVFAKAKDCFVFDEDGKQYLDFFCGAGALNYGHNNEYIKKDVLEYLEGDGLMHALDLYTVPKRRFISTFEEKVLKPRGLDYRIQFTGPTGTNANEAALKLARKVTGRTNVFAMMGAFHGMTLGSLAITTDSSHRKGSGLPLTNTTFIPAPYMYPQLDTIVYMRSLLEDDHSGADKPAALFVETLQAEGGINVMPSEWLKAAYDLCKEYGILFVVDDIQVGCCRTGDFFSFERAGIKPDIVTMSKSIGGYGFPLALALIKPEYDIWAPAEHNGTFRGNQLAFVAANAGLEYMLENKVEDHVKELETVAHDFIAKEILSLDNRLCARGMGLIWGADCSKIPSEGFCGRVLDRCFARGLIIESCGRKGSVVKIMPPLVIDKETLLSGLNIVKTSIEEELKNL